MITKAQIIEARERIAPYIHITPVFTSMLLNRLAGCELFFKCENFQKAGAFKSRGAMNAILQLNDLQLKNGVCTHSSGNHAGALARAAAVLGVKAYIVMPSNAPLAKVEAVRSYGAEIFFCTPTLEARETLLAEVIHTTGAHEIHPYNHPHIVAGQASSASELLEEIPQLDFLVAPVGGGGLLSGTALAAHFFAPETTVIGAEPEGANDAFQSLQSGCFVPSLHPDTICDGLLTSLGEVTYPIIKAHVNAILTADDKEVCDALTLLFERMKIVVEPSSAIALAVVMKNPVLFANKRVGIILSGGNINIKSFINARGFQDEQLKKKQ